jgi:uncharacterized protein YndB with AHSA1/START domain
VTQTMNAPDAYGVFPEPATLRMQRLLPGPIDRVWAYLTQSELRRKWLASGDMELKVGAPVQFTWRNDELSGPKGNRPEGFPEVHSMESRITEVDPPRKLAFTWKNSGDVSFELESRGEEVLLTMIHRRLPDRSTKLSVGPGWHAHLDVLVAVVSGNAPEPFWENWLRLKKEYGPLVPA